MTAANKREPGGLDPSAELWRLFLNQLDRTSGKPDHHDRREHERWPHRDRIGIRVVFRDGDDTTECFLPPRNLSAGGIALLNDAYVSPGTRCTVTLRDAQGTTVGVSGRVADSRHVYGRLHEIGIAFDEPIDPAAFAPIQACLSESS